MHRILHGDSFPKIRQLYERDQTQKLEMEAEKARNSDDPEYRAQAPLLETLASESAELMGASAHQVQVIESFGDLPIVVIGATEPNPDFGERATEYQAFWIEESQKVAAKSTRGQFILAEGSSHHINKDIPELVLEAVREMLDEVRRK